MAVPLSRRAVLMLPLAVALSGCDMSLAHLTARAADEWTHTYPLNPGGEIRIINTNGRIDVEAGDSAILEVRAERIARGATDEAAKELLPRIVIKEDAKPERVTLETERMSGIMIGANFEVRYRVKAPKNAFVNVTNTNGLVSVTGMTGKVVAHTTNGGVRGTGLAGGVDARATNGQVAIDMAAVGADKIALETTNGGVTLALPEKARATVSASCTNGGISVGSMDNFEVTEKSRRHLEGKLNGGGTEIELTTTNGGVRLRSHDAINTRTDTDLNDKEKDERKDR